MWTYIFGEKRKSRAEKPGSLPQRRGDLKKERKIFAGAETMYEAGKWGGSNAPLTALAFTLKFVTWGDGKERRRDERKERRRTGLYEG